jgi:hypothetical protein
MSILFGGGKTTQAAATPHETALNVQSSSAGKVVAAVLGTQRVAGNLCWYGDFQAIAHTSSSGGGGKGGGGSGGGSTTYTYTASTIIGLCNGAIQDIGKVWSADDVVSLASLGSIVSLKTGALGQAVWPWLQAAHPSEAIGYSGLAYVGIANADLGGSANLPNWNWEVRGLGTPKATDADGNYDIGFPEAIDLVANDPAWGCGAGITISADDYGLWCDAHGFVMSDAFQDAKSGRDILSDYLTATLAEAVWSGDTLKIVPYADQEVVGETTYTPDLTPALIVDDSMLLPAESDDETPIKVTRKDPADYTNYVTVEYYDRSSDYNVETVTATDDAHIATHRRGAAKSVPAHFFHAAAVAQHSADLVQAREISVTATYAFRLGPAAAILEPMDIVWLNDLDQGLANHPVRVKRVSEDDAFSFAVEAEEIPGVVGSMVSRTIETANGHRSGFNVVPAPCNPPVIFEAPAELTSGTGLEVWIAVSGADTIWSGCQIWVSTDDETYQRIGTLEGSSRTGILSTNLPIGLNPDTINTLAVDLSESRGELGSGTRADADLFSTLCWVDGELISYEAATLAAAYSYNLTYLRRGAYGTEISAHSAAGRFARLDGAVFKFPFTADMIGQTIYVKCLGFNQYGGGLQSLAEAAAYAYTITGKEPPADVPSLYRQGNRIYWPYPEQPADLAGFRVRVLAGRTRNWAQGSDWPSDGAVTTAREIMLDDLGTSEQTVMVRAVDTSGNLSTGTVYLTVGLGEYAPANLIATTDEKAAGFAGTITGGSVEGSGSLVADDTGDLYLPDGNALYLPQASAPYLPLNYGEMSYAWTFRPAAADVPGSAYLTAAVAADGWRIEYRRRGSAESYLGNDDEAYLPDGAALYLGGPTAWARFPGAIEVGREAVDFRVTTDAGARQGTVSALAVHIDVPDIVESFNDLVIAAGGTRVPITRSYRVIDFVGSITLQDDGAGASGVRILDKNPVLGPLLAAIGGTQATIDIANMKGH